MSYVEKETLIHVEKLDCGYNGKIILKDINFTERNIFRDGINSTGQVIAFIGRSGRGKSTLFKTLTCLEKPLGGKMLVSDFSTEDKDDAKHLVEGDIGFVDQKYTLFRHKTIFNICMYALRKSKLTKVEKTEKILHYLEDWGLLEHKDKYSCELSGGQRQRTAIIEQIMSSKFFMILDEPASGLDVGNIEKLKHYFKQIGEQNENNTIIFSTHDLALAAELADSIYIIGFPEGVSDYSTIVKHYDLKKMGLAWKTFGPEHINLIRDMKEVLLRS